MKLLNMTLSIWKIEINKEDHLHYFKIRALSLACNNASSNNINFQSCVRFIYRTLSMKRDRWSRGGNKGKSEEIREHYFPPSAKLFLNP